MATLEIYKPLNTPRSQLDVKPSFPNIEGEMEALKQNLFIQKQKEIQNFLNTATSEKKEILVEGAESVIDNVMIKYYNIVNSNNYSKIEKEERIQRLVIEITNAQEVILETQGNLGETAVLWKHRLKIVYPNKEMNPEEVRSFAEKFIRDKKNYLW